MKVTKILPVELINKFLHSFFSSGTGENSLRPPACILLFALLIFTVFILKKV